MQKEELELQKPENRVYSYGDQSRIVNPESHSYNEPHEHVDDGYVKYNCIWTQSQPLAHEQIEELNEWRQKLYDKHLIGAYPNKVGFGNVSVRIPGTDKFIVSGTETGNIEKLNEMHYCIVTFVDINANTLYCTGPVRASSESMTHAAAYAADPNISAIIHCHSPTMWSKFIKKIPTTTKSAKYGTPQIANAIQKLVSKEKKRPLLVVMGGHETGMFCVGKDIASVGEEYLKVYKKLKLSPART